jgi:hypothetical protein
MAERFSAGLRGLESGFFGPSVPMTPVLTEKEAQESGAKGRAYDYPTGVNLQTTQSRRGDSGTSFQELRALADAWPVIRLIIETRKDKVCKLRSVFQLKDAKARREQQKSGKVDPRIQKLEEFFEQPDRDNDGSLWTRQILEDLYVLDACTILPRMTYGGELYALELIDPALIVRRVSIDGRTPLPPDPAYSQLLKGQVVADYCLATGAKDWKQYPHDQLIYLRSNPRTHRLYGYSRVEQIDFYVNMALRRMTSQMDYFTAGNMPDWIATANTNWSPEQIEEYWNIWDAKRSGNLAERRKLALLPGGTSEPKEMKEPPLNNEFDLFLAKVACYAFSESPQWIERMMNRATAQTSQEEAKIEGVSVDAEFLSRFKTRIIRDWFGWPDIECVLENEIQPDAKTQADIDAVYIAHGVYSPDYVTDRIGVPEDAKAGRLLMLGANVQKLDDVLAAKVPPNEHKEGPGQTQALPFRQSEGSQGQGTRAASA